MERKVAIVLRGPPGGGKTTISHALQDHFGLPRHSQIILDDGWGPGERRYSGTSRYSDLRNQPNVLIIELGFGEPVGEPFPGATRNPAEWVRILREEGRETFFFVLYISRAQTIHRVEQRRDIPVDFAAMAHQRYEPLGVCSSEIFSALSASPEETINTGEVSLDDTIARILHKVGPLNPR